MHRKSSSEQTDAAAAISSYLNTYKTKQVVINH